MTKQEALAELKDHVRCADWINEDYVYRVSKQVLKIAIGALEREVSTYLGLEKMVENVTRSGKTKEIRALLQEEEVKQMIKKHYSLLESIDERPIEERKNPSKSRWNSLAIFKKKR